MVQDPTLRPAEFQGTCGLVLLALASGMFGGTTPKATWGKYRGSLGILLEVNIFRWRQNNSRNITSFRLILLR